MLRFGLMFLVLMGRGEVVLGAGEVGERLVGKGFGVGGLAGKLVLGMEFGNGGDIGW